MKFSVSALIALALVTFAGPVPAACGAGEVSVFSCSIASNGNRLEVCRSDTWLGYSYGPAKGSPDLELSADIYTDFRPWLDGDAVREDVFRFRNGDYRYDVISGLTASGNDDVAYGRVDVYQNQDRIASLECNPSSLITQSSALYEELDGLALCWNDGLDRWAECPEAEPEPEPEVGSVPGKPPLPSAGETPAPGKVPQPQAPSDQPAQPVDAGSDTLNTVTETQWTLYGAPSCGIGGEVTDYQRFLPTEYYNVITGTEYHADDMRVEYFRVDEARRRFEASYSTWVAMAPAHPWTITEYVGVLQADGSMELSTVIQQVDFDTVNDLVPRYDTSREEETLWPCDNLPEASAGSDGATRVLVQVPDGLDPDAYDSCDAVFNAAFEGLDVPIMTVFEQVDGTWQAENFHTAHCEENSPNMCPLIGGEWTQNPREVSSNPLVLENTIDGCTSSYEFILEGRSGVANGSSRGDCAFGGEPFTYAVIDCAQ